MISGCFFKLLGGQKSLWSRSRRDLPNYWKTFKNIVRYCKNRGSRVQKLMQKWAQEATGDLQKTLPTPIGKKVRFFIDFGSILGANIDAKSHQKISRKSTPQKIDKKRLRNPGAPSGRTTPGLPGEGGGCKHPYFQKPTGLFTRDLTRQWAKGPANLVFS